MVESAASVRSDTIPDARPAPSASAKGMAKHKAPKAKERKMFARCASAAPFAMRWTSATSSGANTATMTAKAHCSERGKRSPAKEERVSATDHIPSAPRSEEHTSELQSLMRKAYDAFCLKKKKTI